MKYKYETYNYKIGVICRINTSTKTMKLTSSNPDIKAKTFKYRWTRRRYLDPNNGSELFHNRNEIVVKFSKGVFN